MGMFQAVDQTFFFAGCFLVSIWQREQEYKYKKDDISCLPLHLKVVQFLENM